MPSLPSRRDFLKLSSMLPLGLATAPLSRLVPASLPASSQTPNVLIVVFDALSAYHMSLHGYGRETTPNLARLAERAVVYHNHYATSNFTTPGTASLLTGCLPWTHRAFAVGTRVSPSFAERSVFRAFSRHHRVVYTHNPLAYEVCSAHWPDLDQFLPVHQLMLASHGVYGSLFHRDAVTATVGWARALDPTVVTPTYSLILSALRREYVDRRLAPLQAQFPLGPPLVPGVGYYELETAIDWLVRGTRSFPQPYFAYIHLLPPHEPYRPPRDSYGHFARDESGFPDKPRHFLSAGQSSEVLADLRRHYDEFILYVDREFARLFEQLEASGALENTWVVLTSDHGELLERGGALGGHSGPLLYEPVIRVPLMIFEPGRRSGLEVQTLTSAVDVVPTLLHVTGQEAVDWSDGALLPPFAPGDANRSAFAMVMEADDPRMPITKATMAIMKHGLKLIYMFGYDPPQLLRMFGAGRLESVELYDLQADPQELDNLSSSQPDVAAELLAELKKRLREADWPYLQSGGAYP